MGATGISGAADKTMRVDIGAYEYRNSCTLCHGVDGKDNTPVNDFLKKVPPDLTTLSKRNGGVFPFKRIYALIDAREAVAEHGPRDMPPWGDRYRSKEYGVDSAEYFADVPYPYTGSMFARSRNLALIDYLNRIQE